jgi:hypothetical protein
VIRYGAAVAAASAFLPALPRALAGEDAPTVAPAPNGGKARRLVVLFMVGGPSHFETFDPKPGSSAGGPTGVVDTTTAGVQIADTLPGLAKRMREICLLRGMTSTEGDHERARYFVHTGYKTQPTVMHPSIGSIVAHEKGKPEAELPEFVAIGGPAAGAGYLGVAHEPFVVQDPTKPIANLSMPAGLGEKRRDGRMDLLEKLNERFARARGKDIPEAQQAMFEKARRLMDSDKVKAFDLSGEDAKAKEAYGSGRFGQSCLMARRLLEAGVTAIEVQMGGYDTHDDNFNRMKALNREMDQGASALLDDLKSRGLLESTLVAWVGDFGRTPEITPTDGRNHYPRAFSTWVAGGGVQGGRVVGRTDERGATVVDGQVTVPDLHASFCHALGIDGSKEFTTNGRPITLVDKAAKVVPGLFSA